MWSKISYFIKPQQNIYISRSTKWCENLSLIFFLFLELPFSFIFLFLFKIFYKLKSFFLRFSHHFADLDELILSIYIVLGFDKISNTIFYFTHTKFVDFLILRTHCNTCIMQCMNNPPADSKLKAHSLPLGFRDYTQSLARLKDLHLLTLWTLISVTVNPLNQEINKIRVCEVKYRIEYFIKP